MTLYQLIFYICLLLFFPSIHIYEVIKMKGLVIIIIESIMRGGRK